MSKEKETLVYVKEVLDENFQPEGEINPFIYILRKALGERIPTYNVLSNGNVIDVVSGEVIGVKTNGKIIPIDKVLNGKRIKEQHYKNHYVDMSYPFELIKKLIGITDKNRTRARQKFERAWDELKDNNLVEEHSYKIWTSKKDNTEYIKIIFTER